jgi:hypothetical protein
VLTARAAARAEQFSNVAEPQAEGLGLSNECEPIHDIGAVDPEST